MTEQTTITCEQLSNFMHDAWMDITNAKSVLEVEIKLDMLDDTIGQSLASCIGYEVLNNLTDEWSSNSKILESIKYDAKDIAQTLHRDGLDGEGEKFTAARFNMLLKRIEQIGRDPRHAVAQSPSRASMIHDQQAMDREAQVRAELKKLAKIRQNMD